MRASPPACAFEFPQLFKLTIKSRGDGKSISREREHLVTSAKLNLPPHQVFKSFHFNIWTPIMESMSSRLNLSEEKQISCKEIGYLLLVFLPGAWQDFTAVLLQLSSALYSKETLLLILMLCNNVFYTYLISNAKTHCTKKASVGSMQCLSSFYDQILCIIT